MNAVAFDTLKFAQALRDKANLSPTQAEGISQAFSEAIAGQLATRDDLANLATKDDLAALRSATKEDLADLRGATKDEFAALRSATKEDLAAFRSATKDEFAAFRGATKDDMTALRSDLAALRTDVNTLEAKIEAKIDAKIEASKSEIIKWMFGTIGFQTIIVLGAVVALAHVVH
jgi:Protein of unknown function (DUF1640)